MDPLVARTRGRPYGGIAIILSKAISHKLCYKNSRCLSIILTDSNILVNNVYLPFDDSRKNAETNVESMTQAISHLDAAHNIAFNVNGFITLGDFNIDVNDRTTRSNCVQEFLDRKLYVNTDVQFYTGNQYSHDSGRLLDRIITSNSLASSVKKVKIPKEFQSSDHFVVTGELLLTSEPCDSPTFRKSARMLCWKKARAQSLTAYSKLSQKKCLKTKKYQGLNFIQKQ